MQNRPQKFMVQNLDGCFYKENSFNADYFFMLEDDNQVRPDFMTRGIEIIEQTGVNVCQLNQVIEHLGTAQGSYSDFGIFDGIYDERVHEPREIRLALFGWAAISNGSVFWSKNIRRELAYRSDIPPGIDEEMRAMLLQDRVYVCREKLGVWAKDEVATTRNLGFKKGKLRRELDMQASAKAIRRAVWRDTPAAMRKAFLGGDILRIPLPKRHYELQRAGISVPEPAARQGLTQNLKVNAVRLLGNVHPAVGMINLADAPS